MSVTTYHIVTLPSKITLSYARAGNPSNPTILLLHGFPTSSNQYRNLIPLLAEKYYILAPDLPGYGHTVTPSGYSPTFASLATTIGEFLDKLEITELAIYIFDYGAPTGFRLAVERSDLSIKALISQNGNAYEAGLGSFWEPVKDLWATEYGTSAFDTALAPIAHLVSLATTKWQYINGVPANRLDRIDPNTYHLDHSLNLLGNENVTRQVALLYDYRNNVPLYPVFQKYLRDSKVPVLAVWGKNDEIFVPAGAEAFEKDVRGAFRLELFDGGHFLLETHGFEVAALIKEFLASINF